MSHEDEECPDCDEKFVDLRSLSDHYDKNHGSSSEDGDNPQELSRKGKRQNKRKNSAAMSESKSSKQKGQKQNRDGEGGEQQAKMWKEVMTVRRRQKEAEEELTRKNKKSEEEVVRKGRQMTEQIEKKYDEKIATLLSAKKKEVAVMADEVSSMQKSLAKKNQEMLDSLRSKHKTEEVEMVTQLLSKFDDEEVAVEGDLDGEVAEQPHLPPAPDCPICFEPMAPPTRIYQCGAGHLLCGACRPRLLVA